MRLRYFSDIARLRRVVRNPVEVTWFREVSDAGRQLDVRFRDETSIQLRSGFPDHHMFHRIFVQDEYRLGAYGANRWGVVMDLGANVGIFSSRVAPFAERVIAFEPVPDNFELLQKNLHDFTNVTLEQAGVSGEAGTLVLHRPVDPVLTGTFSAHDDLGGGLMGQETLEVPVVTLEGALDDHSIDRVSLMKIDVEGQEYSILESASDETLRRIDRISGEYHDVSRDGKRCRVEDLVARLEQAGFRVELDPHRKKENHGMFFAVRQ